MHNTDIFLIFQADLFGEYMFTNGMVRGQDVCKFKLVNIPFCWQVHHSLAGYTDCGVYLMMHMLFYNGKQFDCDLVNKKSRSLYRAEITAILVLSDLNINRPLLLESVDAFEGFKQGLLPGLVLKRKQEDQNRLLRILLGPYEDIYVKTTKSSVLGSRKRLSKKHENNGLDDGLGCSLQCTPRNKSLVLVSKYMREYKKEFEHLLFLRKLALDYCFLTDHTFPPG